MNIIADSCFWFSLCDPSEENHEEVVEMMEKIYNEHRFNILVPHPVLYETLSTKMVKKPYQVKTLLRHYVKAVKVPDDKYVEEALKRVKDVAEKDQKGASMVDVSIMLMAEDKSNQVKAILTMNGRDFDKPCAILRIPMIDNMNKLCQC